MAVLALARVRGALERHGIAGTLQLLVVALRDGRDLRRQRAVDKSFDREHGVDTAGIIPLRALEVPHRSAALGERYQATTPEVFHRIFAELDADLQQFTFIDIGAGKGRALLLASEYPFRRIVGVEFSHQLVSVAERNVARWIQKERACRDITVLCCDATEFDPPAGPLVLYFNNPFRAPVMRATLERIHQSVDAEPRPVLLALRGEDALVDEVLASGFVELEVGRWPRVFTLDRGQPITLTDESTSTSPGPQASAVRFGAS
jgi:predicted RNA methylase